jgi:hypothetical protein
MSTETSNKTITTYESALGEFILTADYKGSEFVSGKLTRKGWPFQLVTFKSSDDLTSFIQCIKEFESEMKK